MAESNFIEERFNAQNNEKFQSVVRRKFDRFRTKIAELFFSSPTKTHNQRILEQKEQVPDDNNFISNFYYGYTSPITEEDLRISCKKKSKNQLKKTHTSSSNSSGSTSSACSSSSSMIIDDDEHSTGELSQIPVDFGSQTSLPHSLTTGVITLNRSHLNQQPPSTLEYYMFNSQLNSQHSNYDTSSLNTNEESVNPFFNKRLTDQIHFNSDLNQLGKYFEHALDLIDDQDNFFNIEFMTNYIAYILLKQLHEQNKWDLKLTPNQDKNLLKEIAEQIFVESRDEPCGLKGCNISVFVQSEDSEQTLMNELVSKFQFGTSRFGTFDINLILKKDQTETELENQRMVHQQSAIATLTRRFLGNNKTSTKANNTDETNKIYLNSSSFDLFKTNLAYE